MTAAQAPVSSSLPNPSSPAISTHSLAGCPQALAHDAGNLLLALNLYGDLLNLPGVLQPKYKHYASELQLLGRRSSILIDRLLETHAGPEQRPQSDPSQSDPSQTAASQTAASQTAASQTAASKRATSQRTPSQRAASRIPDPARMLHRFAPLLAGVAGPLASVSVAAEPSLPSLPFAAEVLERILVNLVRNAAEAIASLPPALQSQSRCSPAVCNHAVCDHAGHIWVTLTTAGDSVHLTVRDDGPGMAPAAAAAFLHPAPLLPGARRGLGHRIVHELVTATAGRLSVSPASGGGALIGVAWPMSQAAARSRRSRKPWQPSHPSRTTLFKGVLSTC